MRRRPIRTPRRGRPTSTAGCGGRGGPPRDAPRRMPGVSASPYGAGGGRVRRCRSGGAGRRGACCGARRRDPVSASSGVCLDGGRGRAPDGRDALVRVAPGRLPGFARGDVRPRLKRQRRPRFRQPLRQRTPHPERARRSRGSKTPRRSIGWRARSRRPWSAAWRGRSGISGSRTRGAMPSPCISRPSSPQPKRSRLSRPARRRPATPATSSCRPTCPRLRRGRGGPSRTSRPASRRATSRNMPGRRRRRRRNRLRLRSRRCRCGTGRGQRNARASPAARAAPTASPSLRPPRPMPQRPTRASGARTSNRRRWPRR